MAISGRPQRLRANCCIARNQGRAEAAGLLQVPAGERTAYACLSTVAMTTHARSAFSYTCSWPAVQTSKFSCVAGFLTPIICGIELQLLFLLFHVSVISHLP